MKTLLASLVLTLSLGALAQDMSRTETYEQSYRENEDGSTSYVGGCAFHEDYEDRHFSEGKTLVAYFEPDYEAGEEEIMARLNHVNPKLIAMAREHVGGELSHVDDLTLIKLKSSRFPGMNLYRFSIGVGGGNGMYLVYGKFGSEFVLLSDTFDGDLNFCDKRAWLN